MQLTLEGTDPKLLGLRPPQFSYEADPLGDTLTSMTKTQIMEYMEGSCRVSEVPAVEASEAPRRGLYEMDLVQPALLPSLEPDIAWAPRSEPSRFELAKERAVALGWTALLTVVVPAAGLVALADQLSKM